MRNHIHLVLRMGEKHISHAIQHLALRYSVYINRKEKRVGHLFQGRFKAILVDDHDYLLELIRYVHLNPVRVKLVNQPEDYFWSGHRSYLGLENLVWLNQDYVLKKFDSHEMTARSRYLDYIRRGIGQEMPDHGFKYGSHEGRFLGTDEFVQTISSLSVHQNSTPSYSLEELLEKICQCLEISMTVLCSPRKQRVSTKARGIAALLVKDSSHLTLKAFADFVAQDVSALSKLADRIQLKSKSDRELHATIEGLKSELTASNVKCHA